MWLVYGYYINLSVLQTLTRFSKPLYKQYGNAFSHLKWYLLKPYLLLLLLLPWFLWFCYYSRNKVIFQKPLNRHWKLVQGKVFTLVNIYSCRKNFAVNHQSSLTQILVKQTHIWNKSSNSFHIKTLTLSSQVIKLWQSFNQCTTGLVRSYLPIG